MTVSEINETIGTIQLFNNINGIEEYVRICPPVELKLRTGDKYEIKNSFALFVSGKAELVKESDNKSAYMKSLNGISLIGLATLFDDENEYISTLVAKTESVILLFPQKFVELLIQNEPSFAIGLVKLLCQKVRYLNRRIDFYTCSGAEKKLHEFLLHSCDSDGKIIVSMSKLSETLDIGRASLYRAITALEEKGYIIKDGKKILLLK